MKKIYSFLALCLMGTAAVSADSGVSNVYVHDETSHSATITFDGTPGSKYEVRYKVEDKGGLHYGFDQDLDGWDAWDIDGDGFNWEWASSSSKHAHKGRGCLVSASYDKTSQTALTPNNFLLSPDITLGHTVTLWARGQDSKLQYAQEHFTVYAATDDDWNNEDIVGEVTTTNEYQRYDFDISHLNGRTGQIAIRHHNSTDQYFLNIDDVTIFRDGEHPGDIEWTVTPAYTTSYSTNNLTLNSLLPDETYTVQVRVQGHDDWSEVSFTTLAEAPEECEVTGVGDFEDVVHSQIDASQFGNLGRLVLGFFTNENIFFDQEGQLIPNGQTGKVFVATIYPERLNSLQGMYDLDDDSGIVELSDGQISSFSQCTGGTLIVNLNEERTAYDMVCTMSFPYGEEYQGVITGVCADEIDPKQDIENVQSDKVQGTKVIENGVLYLMYNGTKYNVQGMKCTK